MRRCVGVVFRAIPSEAIYHLGEVLKSVTIGILVSRIGEVIIVLSCIRQSVSIGIEGSWITAYVDVLDTLIDYSDGPTDDLDAIDEAITIGVSH